MCSFYEKYFQQICCKYFFLKIFIMLKLMTAKLIKITFSNNLKNQHHLVSDTNWQIA